MIGNWTNFQFKIQRYEIEKIIHRGENTVMK